jgi:hypothetical protein
MPHRILLQFNGLTDPYGVFLLFLRQGMPEHGTFRRAVNRPEFSGDSVS